MYIQSNPSGFKLAVIFEPWWAPATVESESGLQKLWTNKTSCKSDLTMKLPEYGMAVKAKSKHYFFYINSTAKNTFFSESVCMQTGIYMFLTVYLFVA